MLCYRLHKSSPLTRLARSLALLEDIRGLRGGRSINRSYQHHCDIWGPWSSVDHHDTPQPPPSISILLRPPPPPLLCKEGRTQREIGKNDTSHNMQMQSWRLGSGTAGVWWLWVFHRSVKLNDYECLYEDWDFFRVRELSLVVVYNLYHEILYIGAINLENIWCQVTWARNYRGRKRWKMETLLGHVWEHFWGMI